MKRYILLCVLGFLLVVPSLVFGQAKVGTAGAQFLEIGVSARAIGMGEAFLGLADDASALYYNPGGLARLERTELMVTHIDYPANIGYEFIGFVTPVPELFGNIGLATYWLHTDQMKVTTYENPEGNGYTFSAGDFALAATYSASLTDNFSVGVTMKYIHSFLELESASGWATDVGTYYNTGYRGFTICMMIANFGPDMHFFDGEEGESFPLPIDFRFGWAINLIEGENQKLTWGLQASRPNDNLEKFNTGFEYWFNDVLALRAGKKFQYDFINNGNLPPDADGFDDRLSFGVLDGMTFGGGIKLPVSDYSMQIDYALQGMGYLGNVHRVSFGLKF